MVLVCVTFYTVYPGQGQCSLVRDGRTARSVQMRELSYIEDIWFENNCVIERISFCNLENWS